MLKIFKFETYLILVLWLERCLHRWESIRSWTFSWKRSGGRRIKRRGCWLRFRRRSFKTKSEPADVGILVLLLKPWNKNICRFTTIHCLLSSDKSVIPSIIIQVFNKRKRDKKCRRAHKEFSKNTANFYGGVAHIIPLLKLSIDITFRSYVNDFVSVWKRNYDVL